MKASLLIRRLKFEKAPVQAVEKTACVLDHGDFSRFSFPLTPDQKLS